MVSKEKQSIFKSRELFLIFILFTPLLLFNQEKIKFKHLSLEEGLSQSTIFCIVQDYQGFLWFGAESGLNKYDGYQFTPYLPELNNPNSLSNSQIKAIFEDSNQDLWIGTDFGLDRYDRVKNHFINHRPDPQNPQSLLGKRVVAICEDNQRNLWIGTDKGLNLLNRENKTYTHFTTDSSKPFTSLSHNSVNVMIRDKDGFLWIGTNGGGLNKFDPLTRNFTHYKYSTKNTNSIRSNNILSLYQDTKEYLWIGTLEAGLSRFNIETGEFIHFQNHPDDPQSLSGNRVTSIFQDSSKVLWVGTYDRGLNKYNPSTKKFYNYQHQQGNTYSLSGNRILSIYEDLSGVIWFGTFGAGLNKFDRGSQKFNHYSTSSLTENSLSHNLVRPIYEDPQKILWIGTDGGGLNRFDRVKDQFTHYKHDPKNSNSLSNDKIFSLIQDKKGILWIGTMGGGINRFNPKKNTFRHFKHNPNMPNSLSSNEIRRMIWNPDGRIWIGTNENGICLFDPKTEKSVLYQNDPNDHNTLSEDRIYSLFLDSDKILWIGTNGGGLNRFDLKTNQFKVYKSLANEPNCISNNYVLSILEARSGHLWIGTIEGLNRFDSKTETFITYKLQDGLPDSVIYEIMEDDQGNIWTTTNKGVSKFSPQTKTFKNYDTRDGLQSNEHNTYAAFNSPSGEMFIGGINGFNSFHPNKIHNNTSLPKIVITAFQLFNKPVPIGEMGDGRILLPQSITETREINLTFKDYVFSFEFSALHFSSPEKNQYAYMLEGLDKDWNYVKDRRFVTYTGLPPGEYTFMVKASNNDGIWNETPTSIRINIHPPFWKTWWFLSITIITLLSIGFMIFRWRVSQYHRHKIKLEELVENRTKQLADSNQQLVAANKELEKLSIVASKTENGVAILDPKGNIEWINDGFSRMYDESFTQKFNGPNKNIIKQSTYEGIEPLFNQMIKDKKPVRYEFTIPNNSGRMGWTQTTLTPILDETGTIKKIIAIDSDITKVKKAEKAAERQREIAVNANQSKGEFLARMSHEIRTPMNGVIGFTEMLLDTKLDDEQLDYAKTIARSSESLITLLNDILDFSKIEAGELVFDPIDFDPEITVFDICELLRPRTEGKNIELLCRIGDHVPAYVKSDAGRFRQVIINLMGNASKFTENGEIELSLDVDKEEIHRMQLHVKVRDTGIGIPKEKRERIFEVFQQADGSTTRKYGGTGLGLAICRQIANLMDGEVWAEGEEGKGSTFHFTCWVDRSLKSAETDIKIGQLAGKRAVIVDDNPTNLEILYHTLTRIDMDVIEIQTAHHTLSAIAKSFKEEKSIDICIIDIQMPKYSGYQLAQDIRNMKEPMSKIPLLAFSSSPLTRTKKYKDAGFNGFLPKPIHRKKLLKMISRLLESGEQPTKQKEPEIITQHTIIEEGKRAVHILLVDDNPINLKLGIYILRKAGYQVTVAKNGEESIKTFTQDPDKYDLIFMDIQMPVMDGREACRVIRKQGFTQIPIIAITAESMKGDREKCLAAGMNDYISKPIKRNEVFKMVKVWCLDRQ